MAHGLARRDFLHGTAAAAACLAVGGVSLGAPAPSGRYRFCAFTKYLQPLTFEELANAVADAGFSGVEAPVRSGGHFSMEEAPDKLPQLAEALKTRGVDITILCTDVVRADQPGAEQCLRTAAALGIKHYRMGFYEYDLDKPVLGQLAEFGPMVKDVAALSRDVGMQALYQNHSGADMVGATLWDIHGLLDGISTEEVALAFDIRHATIEAGLAWPAVFNAMRSSIGAIFVKDFDWRGRNAEHVPLGEGRVDPKFFSMLADSGFTGPVSVHVEYIREKNATKENAEALRRDFVTLQKWLA